MQEMTEILHICFTLSQSSESFLQSSLWVIRPKKKTSNINNIYFYKSRTKSDYACNVVKCGYTTFCTEVFLWKWK